MLNKYFVHLYQKDILLDLAIRTNTPHDVADNVMFLLKLAKKVLLQWLLKFSDLFGNVFSKLHPEH